MNIVETGRKVLEIEADAIKRAISRLDNNFETAVEILFNTQGRIVITGMGKSGLVGKKISATLTSTGTPSVFLHPSEALHGDIGIINQDDTILALSTSGETQEVIRLINLVKRIGVKLVSLVGAPDSTLAQESDIYVDCGIEKEACPIGLVPTASTTLTLAIGDAISIALMEKKGIKEEDLHHLHPGGSIGKKLLKVKHLMHCGEELPTVTETDPMTRVLQVIDGKHFGVAVVLDGERGVKGIITDGDLRRYLLHGGDFSHTTAAKLMTPSPMWIGEDNLAVEALKILEENRITSLIVKDEKNHLLGLLHLHDLWRTEMF